MSPRTLGIQHYSQTCFSLLILHNSHFHTCARSLHIMNQVCAYITHCGDKWKIINKPYIFNHAEIGSCLFITALVFLCVFFFSMLAINILDFLLRYPLCCIRTQPVQCFPRVDLQGVLGTFLSDLQAGLESVCGFSVRMTCKPCYYSYELNRPDTQVLRTHTHTCP